MIQPPFWGAWVLPWKVPCRAAFQGFFIHGEVDVNAREREGLTERTLALMQPRSKRVLSREDAREIVANFSGFFQLLREWAAKDQDPASIIPDPHLCEPTNAKMP